MHAYLLVGREITNLKPQISNLSKKLRTKTLEYPLAKIEDVRSLNNLIRLEISEPTLIVSENIHEASLEALNAFLKNLEEPQENVYFALTAPSAGKVLPTIVSRCQVIKSTNLQIYKYTNEDEIKQFLTQTAGQKLLFFGTIKERDRAIKFVEDLIFYLHGKRDFKNMEILTQTLTRLKVNGNVNLHLSNLAINYGK